jgi:hypothetical protein
MQGSVSVGEQLDFKTWRPCSLSKTARTINDGLVVVFRASAFVRPPAVSGWCQNTEVVTTRVPLQATGSDVPLVPIADALKLAAGKTIID